MRSTAIVLLLSLFPGAAFAAEERPNARAREASPFEFRGEIFSRPAWEPPSNDRDSLKNGAIVGAVVGGLAMGTFVGLICHAFREEGNPSCVAGTLVWAGIGAGAGAAAGAGIDALFQKRRVVSFTVKF